MTRRLLLGGLLLSLCLLVGCTTQAAATEGNTLRVLTERTPPDGMNYQLEQIADAFMKEHADVTVEIEYLPTDKDERSMYLYQLRVEIMAGGGPDIYLLPAGDTIYEEVIIDYVGRGVVPHKVEPLFPDVQQAMMNGVFQNVGPYYDSDRDLHIEALNQVVMNAGVIGGQRYVLPLRYNMPVLLENPDDPRLTMADHLSVLDLAEQAVAANDTMLAMALQMPNDFSALPRLFDYENGKVLLPQEEIVKYLKLYQQVCAMRTVPLETFLETTFDTMVSNEDPELRPKMEDWDNIRPFGLGYFCDITRLTAYSIYWKSANFPLYIGNLYHALHNTAIDQYFGTYSLCQPLCTSNGITAAEITYFGAVGASCGIPALAYDFLREFLSEAAQWDMLRPITDYSDADIWHIPFEVQNHGFVENSWPVRTIGSVPSMWDTVRYQLYGGGQFGGYGVSLYNERSETEVREIYSRVALTDEDLPILFTPIDEVRFPVTLPEDESMAWALAQLNEEDGTPTDVDIDALAEQLHQNLWWHLAEG